MSIVSRCHGRVDLGELPNEARARLASIPGEWLEYDPESGAVLVRHVQPTDAPVLAATASELVRILDEIPQHRALPGVLPDPTREIAR